MPISESVLDQPAVYICRSYLFVCGIALVFDA